MLLNYLQHIIITPPNEKNFPSMETLLVLEKHSEAVPLCKTSEICAPILNFAPPTPGCSQCYCNQERGQCILFSVVFTSSSPISLLLTNTVSPMRSCLRRQRFRGTQTKTIMGLLVFSPLYSYPSIYTSIFAKVVYSLQFEV